MAVWSNHPGRHSALAAVPAGPDVRGADWIVPRSPDAVALTTFARDGRTSA